VNYNKTSTDPEVSVIGIFDDREGIEQSQEAIDKLRLEVNELFTSRERPATHAQDKAHFEQELTAATTIRYDDFFSESSDKVKLTLRSMTPDDIVNLYNTMFCFLKKKKSPLVADKLHEWWPHTTQNKQSKTVPDTISRVRCRQVFLLHLNVATICVIT
jgi:hypothetical protein